MCDFFSFCSYNETYLYSEWEDRKRDFERADSHTAILMRAGIDVRKQENWQKYEYNLLTKAFFVDTPDLGGNHDVARRWVERLDWSTIVPDLAIKPIVNPFELQPPSITDEHVRLLAAWNSVGASVRDSMGASVRDSVGASVWNSVGDSVWNSMGVSVRDSVGASVWNSVGDSVWNSVGASVRAYISSFFTIKYSHDPTSAVLLWDQGIVPSFDGTTWRLHGGRDAKVLYTISAKDLAAHEGKEKS
jgi:hypothetical protein